MTQKRRTQAERSTATRNRLLTATVDCLYELGYHRTTTASVEQRAGVTRGALMHQFASKSALIIATAQYIVQSSEDQLLSQARAIGAPASGPELTDLLWRQFTQPAALAFIEISMAARTDPVLAQALAEPQKRLDAQCRRVLTEFADASSAGPDLAAVLELTIRQMRGAALAMIMGEPPTRREALNLEWQRLIAPRLTPSPLGG